MLTTHLNLNYKKNLLDLHYQKYLQYKIVSVIFMFTFFIAVVIGFLTKQLSMTNKIDLLLVGIFTVVVIGIGSIFLKRFNYHLKRIPIEIKKLC